MIRGALGGRGGAPLGNPHESFEGGFWGGGAPLGNALLHPVPQQELDGEAAADSATNLTAVQV